jgi:hypothetical protein
MQYISLRRLLHCCESKLSRRRVHAEFIRPPHLYFAFKFAVAMKSYSKYYIIKIIKNFIYKHMLEACNVIKYGVVWMLVVQR